MNPGRWLWIVASLAALVCPAASAQSDPTPTLACGSCLFVVTDLQAEIHVGGRLVGRAPLLVEGLEAGTATLTVRSGALVDEVTLDVDPSRPDVVRYFAQLRPRGATLSVSSDPPGAAVFLDGARSGVAPVTISGVKAGDHGLRLELEGHEPREQRVSVAEGAHEEVSVSLQAAATADSAPVEVRISGIDASCVVVLDGRTVSGLAAAGQLGVEAGAHALLVAKADCVPLLTRFVTEGGAPIVVTYRPLVDLPARDRRRAAVSMPLIVGGAAAVAGGLLLNMDRVAIAIAPSYQAYAATKYATLGTACAGVVCSLVGLLLRLL